MLQTALTTWGARDQWYRRPILRAQKASQSYPIGTRHHWRERSAWSAQALRSSQDQSSVVPRAARRRSPTSAAMSRTSLFRVMSRVSVYKASLQKIKSQNLGLLSLTKSCWPYLRLLTLVKAWSSIKLSSTWTERRRRLDKVYRLQQRIWRSSNFMRLPRRLSPF